MFHVLVLFVVLEFSGGYDFDGSGGLTADQPHVLGAQSIYVSQGGGVLEAVPINQPISQGHVSQGDIESLATNLEHWEEEVAATGDKKNCLLCELEDSGRCRAQPSCVYCEKTVTALCQRGAPCLRCTVIKNPFFHCSPGEKYMDECDSCRCTDGHSGWCSDMFCEYRPLYLYAMKLSDSELHML